MPLDDQDLPGLLFEHQYWLRSMQRWWEIDCSYGEMAVMYPRGRTVHEVAQRWCPTWAWWFGHYLYTKRLSRQIWAWVKMGGCPDYQGMAHPTSGLKGSLAEGHSARSDAAANGEALLWKLHVAQLCAYFCLSSSHGLWGTVPMCPLGTRAGFNVFCALAPPNAIKREKKQLLPLRIILPPMHTD